jgi:hypothetical protein
VNEHVILTHDPALFNLGSLVHPKQVIDLTIHDDEDGQEDDEEVC